MLLAFWLFLAAVVLAMLYFKWGLHRHCFYVGCCISEESYILRTVFCFCPGLIPVDLSHCTHVHSSCTIDTPWFPLLNAVRNVPGNTINPSTIPNKSDVDKCGFTLCIYWITHGSLVPSFQFLKKQHTTGSMKGGCCDFATVTRCLFHLYQLYIRWLTFTTRPGVRQLL